MIFWRLFLAHVLTDFVFQPDYIAEHKSKFGILLLHGSIFFLLSTVMFLPSFSSTTIVVLGMLALSHGFVDYLKNLIQRKLQKGLWICFLGDQCIHMLGMGAVAYFMEKQTFLRWVDIFSSYWSNPLTFVFVSLGVLIVFGGGYFTGILCKGFLEGMDSERRPGIERAGRYIGLLERAMVLAAVLLGKLEFIGYIFAAKSIARYPEIREGSHFAEYYLIGTLTSISIAFFGGLTLKYLLKW